MGTFNLSAKCLSKKDSSTMLPELTEFVPAIRMGIVRSWKPCKMHCFHFFSMLLIGAYASKFETGWEPWVFMVQLCIVWFFIPENCLAQANRKFHVQLYVKFQILFEPPFWICKWANHLSFLAICFLYKIHVTLQCIVVSALKKTI